MNTVVLLGTVVTLLAVPTLVEAQRRQDNPWIEVLGWAVLALGLVIFLGGTMR